jgi:hypothetical protein
MSPIVRFRASGLAHVASNHLAGHATASLQADVVLPRQYEEINLWMNTAYT